MKATSLLKQQHRNTRRALTQLAKSGEPGREKLRAQMADELVAHMAIEERIFYPTARRTVRKPELVEGSYEEHDVAKFSLIRLLQIPITDPTFEVKARVLKKLLDSHIKVEEEELFPMLERAMEEAELKRLGDEMKQLFDKTVEAGYEESLRDLQFESPLQSSQQEPGSIRKTRAAEARA